MKKYLLFLIIIFLITGHVSVAQFHVKPGQRKTVSMPFPDKMVKQSSDLIQPAGIPLIKKPSVITAESLEKNVSSFLFAASGKCPPPEKPIPQIELKAKRINDLHVDLQWETKHAAQAMGFNVERSIADTLHFETVNFHRAYAGKGISQKYSLADGNAFSAISYYRIRQLNANKKFIYSNISSIDGLNNLTLKVYPNPATAKVYLKTLSSLYGRSTVSVYDAKGQVVLQENRYFNKGSRSTNGLDVSKLSSGLYHVKLVLPDNTVLSGKFVKE